MTKHQKEILAATHVNSIVKVVMGDPTLFAIIRTKNKGCFWYHKPTFKAHTLLIASLTVNNNLHEVEAADHEEIEEVVAPMTWLHHSVTHIYWL